MGLGLVPGFWGWWIGEVGPGGWGWFWMRYGVGDIISGGLPHGMEKR